ncbi:MAG TPA: restriction endonuclease subunit S [Candidatus Macondimonas sp.]|nr:restriction endonuclease subunit S [Candidatus Macondimonas sp.]
MDFNPGIDKSKFRDEDEMPFVPMPAVEAETGRIDTSARRPFGEVKSGFTAFASGDVLFAKITPCMENGKMAVAPALPRGVGFGTTEFHVLRPTQAVITEWIYYFVSSAALRHEAQHHMTGAVGQKRVPRRYLETKAFPLPPLNEQRRIVEKIETLFARLDQGEAALRQTQQLLARYRQSVLKAAVTGALTADWRAQNAHRLEHGRDLLARILQTRRQTWQGRGKYQEPAAPDTTNLPELPEGWVWATLEQLCSLHNGDRGKNYPSKANFVANGVPFVNAGHLQRRKINRAKLDYISEGDFELLRAGFIQKNDILYCIRGSLGKFAISDIERGAIASSLVILRPIELRLLGYLSAYLECPFVREEISKYDNGTAQPNLSARDLAKFVVPLPGILEVDAIGQVVSDSLRESEIVALHCQTELTRSAALRQSILKDAFAGKLVPQDPTDEPAADLLARLRATSRAGRVS